MRGRTVKIYLVDGIPSGVMTAEIMNWIGKFTVAPRNQLADLAQRKELNRTGVYVLVGQNPNDLSQDIVYIGESENIIKRLIQHNNNPSNDFWVKTIIISSKDENLTKAHIRYLESRLIKVALQAKRAIVNNNTNPEVTRLPEPDVADMEYFLEQIRMILPVLGFTFAMPIPNIHTVENPENPNSTDLTSPIFYFTYAGTNAEAQEINGEFIVFESSTVRKEHTNSFSDSYLQIREKLQREGKLIDSQNPSYWILTQNVPFPSPSAAANIIGGASLNGRQHWKVKDTGISYAQWQDEQIKKADEVEFIQSTDEE